MVRNVYLFIGNWCPDFRPSTGTIRLSCPFRLDRSYDEPFAVSTGANDSAGGFKILPHQHQLYIPDASFSLSIHIEHHNVSLFIA